MELVLELTNPSTSSLASVFLLQRTRHLIATHDRSPADLAAEVEEVREVRYAAHEGRPAWHQHLPALLSRTQLVVQALLYLTAIRSEEAEDLACEGRIYTSRTP